MVEGYIQNSTELKGAKGVWYTGPPTAGSWEVNNNKISSYGSESSSLETNIAPIKIWW